MGKLTTHVLDTVRGTPGKNIRVELYRINDTGETLIKTVTTNHDGRTDSPILNDEEFKSGKYQLVFYTAEYFKAHNVELDDTPFLDDVVIRFGLCKAREHYHVPLLVSPYSFSTYRGS